MKLSTKNKFNEFIPMIIGVFVIIAVGIMTIQNQDKQEEFAKGFCTGREGIFNLTNYGVKLDCCLEIVNCSNHKYPFRIDITTLLP
jgi:hypothetical protein